MEPTLIKEHLPKSSQSKTTRKNFDHILLTDEEKEDALYAAKAKKHQQQQDAEYWERVSTPDMPPVMTVELYTKYLVSAAKDKLVEQGKDPVFIVSDGRKEIYNQITKYFVEDATCIYSLQKGIMLQGNIGCGKSFLMKLCSNNPRKSYHVFDCVKLAAEYGNVDEKNKPTGEMMIARFRTELEPKAFDAWKHRSCGAMFDDVGWEDVLKHYGNEVNVMERILNGIYSANLPFSNYHITTNLTAEQLELKYGSRITSRLREMFNQIVLPGKDLRK